MKKKALIASFAIAALSLTSLLGLSSQAQAASRTVVVWSPYHDNNLKLWNAAIKRIEDANPGLEVISVGSIDMEKSLAAINTDKAPDISVSNGAGNMAWFCGTGAWQNLNRYVTSSRVGINMKTTFSRAANEYTIANHVRCALPFSGETFGFFFNKDVLAKAGFKNPPKTTDELFTMSKALTTFDAKGEIKTAGFVPWSGYYGWGMESMWLGQMFGAKWYMAGGNGVSAFDKDPAWAKALTWQKKFIADIFGGGDFAKGSKLVTKFVASAGDEWSGTGHDLISGRVAMRWDASWMAPMFCTGDNWALEDKCTAMNVGLAPAPVAPNLVSTLYGSGVTGAGLMGISKGSKHVEDAWLVIKGLSTDTKLANDWDAANGSPSPLLSKAAKPTTTPDWLKPIYGIADHPLSGYHAMRNVGEHQDESLLGSLMAAWQAGSITDIKKGLSDLASNVNQIIGRNK